MKLFIAVAIGSFITVVLAIVYCIVELIFDDRNRDYDDWEV